MHFVQDSSYRLHLRTKAAEHREEVAAGEVPTLPVLGWAWLFPSLLPLPPSPTSTSLPPSLAPPSASTAAQGAEAEQPHALAEVQSAGAGAPGGGDRGQ